jgi:hypothetical protein
MQPQHTPGQHARNAHSALPSAVAVSQQVPRRARRPAPAAATRARRWPRSRRPRAAPSRRAWWAWRRCSARCGARRAAPAQVRAALVVCGAAVCRRRPSPRAAATTHAPTSPPCLPASRRRR